jgi:hypothetical protein
VRSSLILSLNCDNSKTENVIIIRKKERGEEKRVRKW